MARKIFVSYKYSDAAVRPLPSTYTTTARHYADQLQLHLDANDHINKGERDGEDLSVFKDETIASSLRNRIYDSSLTIVLISKKMKDPTPEEDQWIPWEIQYSLREKSRENRTSVMNAMLAVVIPDEIGSYEYFVKDNICGNFCRNWNIESDQIFEIIRNNMFNKRKPDLGTCSHGTIHLGDDHSYVHPVKWDEFITDVDRYIDLVYALRENKHNYNIQKQV